VLTVVLEKSIDFKRSRGEPTIISSEDRYHLKERPFIAMALPCQIPIKRPSIASQYKMSGRTEKIMNRIWKDRIVWKKKNWILIEDFSLGVNSIEKIDRIWNEYHFQKSIVTSHWLMWDYLIGIEWNHKIVKHLRNSRIRKYWNILQCLVLVIDCLKIFIWRDRNICRFVESR
jgi:hypothetical protein